MIRWIGIALLFILVPPLVFGQGMPLIHHYDPETTGSHPQNWAITQGNSGYLYFGSQAENILRYDGVEWKWNMIPRTGAIRSLIQFDSRTHWGGVGNFGYLESDSLHDYKLVSLKNQLDSTHHSFEDVWQMVEFEGKLYQRTSNAIQIVSGDTVRVIESEDIIRGLFPVDDELWIYRENKGLERLVGSRFVEISGAPDFTNDRLIAILPFSAYHLLIFRNRGFVKYDGEEFISFQTEADNYLQNHTLYRATAINKSEIALAFLNGGILLMRNEGTVQHILDETNGLPTNVIYEIYTDSEGSLWATSADGIIKVQTNNPLSTINEKHGFTGVVTFLESMGNTFYFGSTDGLFTLKQGGSLRKHPEVDGHVYYGINVNGALFLSTLSGLFQISGDEVIKISDKTYRQFEPSHEEGDVFFGAHVNAIERIEIDGTSAETSEILRSETSEIRDFYTSRDGIWAVTYQNEVLYSAQPEEGLKTYTVDFEDEELPIRNVSSVLGKIRLATDNGMYVYEPSSDSFLADPSFSLEGDPSVDTRMNTSQVFQIEQCSESEIWFRSAQQTKRAVRKNGTWEIIETPYRLIGNDGSIEHIRCNPNGSMWFGGSEGLFHLSDPEWNYETDFNTNITGVLMPNDSLIYGGHGVLSEIPEFTYENNDLRFTYAAASYINPELNTYRVRLQGYDDEWSDWTEEAQKDYTFIPEGTYTFQVQGRNVYEKAGSIDSFTFTILPPWYRTIWAYLGYILITGGIFYGGYRIRINTILREQRIRDDIARDLHDELSSTLSSINFFADAINSQKLGKKENNRFLSLITKSSREAKEKVSDIVWVIHSENDDWENLFLRCKRFAADMLDAQKIAHNFAVQGTFTGRPTITERKNIWLIFRESLTNIARHADANHVNIRFSLNSGELQIRIEDDGKGFDADKGGSDGYGVQNIKERVEQLKGEYKLETNPGKGTRWLIEVPID